MRQAAGLCWREPPRAPGERVGLFGASGAGKSTLVQLLFGLRQPSTGDVVVEGGAAHEPDPASRRTSLGYAGAEPFLMHASVEENLRYGNPGAAREDLVRAVALADATDFIDALPAGYATVIGGRGHSLSDGQRQRLGLARLFLCDPRIFVLDEAFSGLDLETEARVRKNLWPAFADRTALVISHRPVGLDEFDRILFLHDGRFVKVAPDELRALMAILRAAPTARSRRWRRGSVIPSLRIGVVDTGVNSWHSHVRGDVAGCRIRAGPDGRLREDGYFSDSVGHGTAVAGIIREAFPEAAIFAVRVFDDGEQRIHRWSPAEFCGPPRQNAPM